MAEQEFGWMRRGIWWNTTQGRWVGGGLPCNFQSRVRPVEFNYSTASDPAEGYRFCICVQLRHRGDTQGIWFYYSISINIEEGGVHEREAQFTDACVIPPDHQPVLILRQIS